MQDIPLVSVLMTSYNREKYIAEAIESVLASTYIKFELIIVDDNSKDNTVEIAKRYMATDSRIRVYINEKNLGDYPNRNKAAGYASGKYLKYLDSDDLIYPWGLEAMVSCMEKFPDAGFGLMAENFSLQNPLPICLSPREAYLNFYFKGSLISMGPTGAIIKAESFRTIGGFTGKQYVGDTELWYMMAAKFSLVSMPTSLVWWRQHDEQQIKGESKNTGIRYLRYQVSTLPLKSVDCPLNVEETRMALKNLEKLYCRNILLELSRGRIKLAYDLKKYSKINLNKIVAALKKNEYPSNLNEKLGLH